MKIKNQTPWNTQQIKRLILAVAKDEMESKHLKHYVVFVEHKKVDRQRGVRGRAPYGTPRYPGKWMRLFLPKPPRKVDSAELASIIAHEFAHNRGVKHHDMKGAKRYTYAEGWREYYAWAKAYPVELKAPCPKKPVDQQVLRYNRVLASLKRWRTKAKRAQTAIKKLTRQQRYYERVLAAKTTKGKDQS